MQSKIAVVRQPVKDQQNKNKKNRKLQVGVKEGSASELRCAWRHLLKMIAISCRAAACNERPVTGLWGALREADGLLELSLSTPRASGLGGDWTRPRASCN